MLLVKELAKNFEMENDLHHLERAAYLSKADLCTELVQEFPSLQKARQATNPECSRRHRNLIVRSPRDNGDGVGVVEPVSTGRPGESSLPLSRAPGDRRGWSTTRVADTFRRYGGSQIELVENNPAPSPRIPSPDGRPNQAAHLIVDEKPLTRNRRERNPAHLLNRIPLRLNVKAFRTCNPAGVPRQERPPSAENRITGIIVVLPA